MAETNVTRSRCARGRRFSKSSPIPPGIISCSPIRLRVTNTGNVAAQLVSRHWIITDAEQRVQEVKGPGVVGQQPMLKPGESFEYTSGTSIATAVGTMRGSYRMVAEDGRPSTRRSRRSRCRFRARCTDG